MMWKLEYLPEAAEDMEKLNKSIYPQVIKGIRKVLGNPLPQTQGGYGKPLGNKGGNDLTGLYKIKFRSIGIRVVYALKEVDGLMTVVVVSLRSDNQVYDMAAKRRKRYKL